MDDMVFEKHLLQCYSNIKSIKLTRSKDTFRK